MAAEGRTALLIRAARIIGNGLIRAWTGISRTCSAATPIRRRVFERPPPRPGRPRLAVVPAWTPGSHRWNAGLVKGDARSCATRRPGDRGVLRTLVLAVHLLESIGS